jgi:hypothetical protein
MIKNWSEYIKESLKKLSSTDDDILKYTKNLLNDKIEEIFIDIHQKFNTESGDITPDQQFKLDELIEELSKLITSQVHQNLGKDFMKIKSNEIDIETLKSLDDERNSIKEGDDVIVVYFDGGFSIYRFKVQRIRITDPATGSVNFSLGYSESTRKEGRSVPILPSVTYLIEDAYFVITVDTYNDFVKPEERLD